MLLQLSHFQPVIPLCPAHLFPPAFPPFSSCPWVIHISSLASPFPILFLPPSPCLFSTYHLCYLFSVPFPPLSSSHSPDDNPPCDLHFCDYVPVLASLTWSASRHLAPPGPPAAALLGVLSTWLSISASPTGMDECFFFNALGC